MHKKKIVQYVSLIVLLIISFSICMPVFAYNHGAAQEYADKWVFSANPAYRNWISSNSDCANFVSQCMQAGGHPESDDWYYNNYFSQSATWINADELKNYIKNINGGTLLGRWQQVTGTNVSGATFYGWTNNSANIAGYGSEIVFYDYQGNGKMDHCAIIVGTGVPFDPSEDKSRGDLVNSHTEARQHQYWHLEQYLETPETTQIYCFRLNT